MLMLRKLVSAVATLVVLTAPLMACALPGEQMSEEEKDCCRHMAEQCGSPDMAESHSCCTKAAAAGIGAFQIKQREVSPLDTVGQALVASLLAPPVVQVSSPATSDPVFSESPPGHTSVLRI